MQINPITKFVRAYPEFVTTPLELELVTNLFRVESPGHQRIYENEMLKKMSELDKECAIIEGRLGFTQYAAAAVVTVDDLASCACDLDRKEQEELTDRWAQLNRKRRGKRMALADRWSKM